MKKNEALSIAKKKCTTNRYNFINNINVVDSELRENIYKYAAKGLTKKKYIDEVAWSRFIEGPFLYRRNYRLIDLGTRKVEFDMETKEWYMGGLNYFDKEELLNFLTSEEQLKLLCCPAFHNY
jgi:hypothetical protein